MIPEYTLHAHEVHQAVFDTVTTHFSLAAHGYQCDTPMLINVLFKAATDRMSLEAACQELQGVADSNTVREYFDAHYDAVSYTHLDVYKRQSDECSTGPLPHIPHRIILPRKQEGSGSEDHRENGQAEECEHPRIHSVLLFLRLAV